MTRSGRAFSVAPVLEDPLGSELAIDLSDLAKRDGASVPFAVPFEAMRKRQHRRRGFFDRWKHTREPKR